MKKALVVVDMQNDFIDGALGTKEAEQIVSDVAEYIKAVRAEGTPVLATLDTHGENYMDTQEGHFLPVKHCIRGSEGWKLNPQVEAALGEATRLEKPVFGSLALPEKLTELCQGVPDEVELIGLCTDICVVSNALILKAAFPETQVQVRSALCAGVTPQKHDAALETMRSCQVKVI